MTNTILNNQEESGPVLRENPRPRILKKYILIVLLVVVALNAGFFIKSGILNNKGYPDDAEKVFNKMLQESMVTGFMTEQRIGKDSEGNEVGKNIIVYDVTDLRKVRTFKVFERKTAKSDQVFKVKFELISVPEGLFMRFTKLGDMPEDKLNNWFPVIENGKVDPDGAVLFSSVEGKDPIRATQDFMGLYIPGVYDLATRKQAHGFLQRAGSGANNKVYDWFSEDVSQYSEKGKDFYTYDIQTHYEGMLELNQTIAKSVGITLTPEQLDDLKHSNAGKFKFFINKNSSRLERIDTPPINGITQTIYYYDYNVPSNIEMPTGIVTAKFVRDNFISTPSN